MIMAEIIRYLQLTYREFDVVKIEQDGVKDSTVGIVGHFETVDFALLCARGHSDIDHIVFT